MAGGLRNALRITHLIPHPYQLLVQLRHRLRHDANFAYQAHEIRVARQSGDDVLVDVAGDAGARGAAEVDADVEALRADRALEQTHGLSRLVLDVVGFG